MPQRRRTENKNVDPDELENARWGYQAALSNSNSYSSIFWSIFNAMLVANSIVIAGISFASAPYPELAGLLSGVGLIVCYIWFLLSKRHQEYVIYYLLAAREIEEQYFSKSVKTISRGGDFADGRQITLEIGRSTSKRRLGFWARRTDGEKAPYIIMGLFAIIYLGAFLVSFLM